MDEQVVTALENDKNENIMYTNYGNIRVKKMILITKTFPLKEKYIKRISQKTQIL